MSEIRTVLYWQGPGWYGPSSEGRGEDEVSRMDLVSSNREEYDPDSTAWIMGVGTPVWLETPDEYQFDEVVDLR